MTQPTSDSPEHGGQAAFDSVRSQPRRNERFPKTHWSVISQLKSDDEDASVEALNGFIRTYWKPIFFFLRARRYPVDRAEELTQEFMLRLMEEGWLRRADRNRGRLRNFILRILVRFLADQSSDRTTRQKSFEGQLVPVSSLIRDEDRTFEPAANLTPEEVFERRWAVSLVQQVREVLESSYALEGKQVWYDVFAARYLSSSASDRKTETELAESLGLSRDQIRYIQQQTRERFLELLHYEARCQTDEEDVTPVVRELLELALQHVPS